MLLRVDIYPDGSWETHKNGDSDKNKTEHSNKDKDVFRGRSSGSANTLHVSARRQHDENGTILTVGRKNADVIFNTDKCVSRAHCSICVVSSAAVTQEINGHNTIENPKAGAPPSTDEEKAACAASANGSIFVLRDLGSKFGTFVLVDRKSTTKESSVAASSSETDEETDDEPSQLSNATDQKKQLIRLASKGNMIFNMDDSSSPLIVQCGPTGGSTFVVSFCKLEFCVSRITSSAIKRDLTTWAAQIGANLTNQFNVQTVTHLVTPDRVSTAKTICAWASRTPIVTTDFVRALASFITDDDGEQTTTLPKEESFQPTGNLPMDNLDPSLPRNCLKHYNVVILQDKNESEGMILAAGGSVLRTYEWSDEQFFQTDWIKNLKCNKQNSTTTSSSSSSSVPCFIDCRSSRVKKRRKFLLEYIHSPSENGQVQGDIWCVQQKDVATAISTLGLLKDVHGIDILSPNCNNYKLPSQKETRITKQESQNCPTDNDNSQKNENACEVSNEEKLADNSINDSETNRQQDLSCESNDNKIIKDHLPTDQPMDFNDNKRKQRNNEADITGDAESNKHSESQRRKTDEVFQGHDEELNDDESFKNNEDNNVFAERKKLKVNANGWYQAAPQGSRRQFFKRTVEELASKGIVAENPAQTVFCNNLENVSKINCKTKTVNPSNNNGVVDFKRFKKNSIIRNSSLNAVYLQSVLPKESERQLQLELSQKELEKDQRAADALFSENLSNRSRAGGIRQFLSPTGPPKRAGQRRGRGRR